MSLSESSPALCALCDKPYHTNYTRMGDAPGLCPYCWQRDRARELDRVISAKRQAERQGSPSTLTLHQWLTIVSDFEGKCALCQCRGFEALEVWETGAGVTAANAIPCCRSCSLHLHNGFHAALERIAAYLAPSHARVICEDDT